MFLFPQSDDISGGLPQGIGFGEREIYILAKEYFFAKAVLLKERMMKEIEQFATQFRRAIDLALKQGSLITTAYIADFHVLAAEIRVIC